MNQITNKLSTDEKEVNEEKQQTMGEKVEICKESLNTWELTYPNSWTNSKNYSSYWDPERKNRDQLIYEQFLNKIKDNIWVKGTTPPPKDQTSLSSLSQHNPEIKVSIDTG